MGPHLLGVDALDPDLLGVGGALYGMILVAAAYSRKERRRSAATRTHSHAA
jgi:hypothetical protein